MAGQFDDLFARFANLPQAKRRELDAALSFMEQARMPTEQGKKNRTILAQEGVDPDKVQMMGAYAAFKYGLQHQPMDAMHRQLLQLQGVPPEKIAQMDSREKWESDQLNRFDPLMRIVQNVKPNIEMQPEEITAAPTPKKSAKAKPKVSPPVPAPSLPQGAPAATPAAVVPLQAAPLLAAPPPAAPVQPGAAPIDPRIGMLEQERLPLAVQLGGQYA